MAGSSGENLGLILSQRLNWYGDGFPIFLNAVKWAENLQANITSLCKVVITFPTPRD